jgi:hypothetical protein
MPRSCRGEGNAALNPGFNAIKSSPVPWRKPKAGAGRFRGGTERASSIVRRTMNRLTARHGQQSGTERCDVWIAQDRRSQGHSLARRCVRCAVPLRQRLARRPQGRQPGSCRTRSSKSRRAAADPPIHAERSNSPHRGAAALAGEKSELSLRRSRRSDVGRGALAPIWAGRWRAGPPNALICFLFFNRILPRN